MQDFASWLDGVPIMSPLAFVLVALGGLVMGMAPSSLPLIGVMFGFVAGESRQSNRTQGLRLALGFVLGMATVDAAVGALFGFLGFVVVKVMVSYLALTNLVIALLLIVMSLALLRLIRIKIPVLTPGLKKPHSFAGAYTLGIPFGLSTCPACTPMILPVLGAAAATGEPWLGAALMFGFGLARGIPMLVAGAATGAVKRFERVSAWVPFIERAGGILLLIAAVYFVYQSAVYQGWVRPLWALDM